MLQEEEDMLVNVSLRKVCIKDIELWKKPNYLPYSKENSGQLGQEEVALHPGQVRRGSGGHVATVLPAGAGRSGTSRS